MRKDDILYGNVKIHDDFELLDTVYDDVRIEPTARNVGVKAPTFGTFTGGIFAYLFDNAVVSSEKELFFQLQLPHAWKEGTVIYPHVHWSPLTTGSAGEKVRWGLEYTVAKPGGTFGATGTIYGADLVPGVGGTTPTQNVHYITPLGSGMAMTGNTLSSVIAARVFRNSSHGDDTFTGTVAMLYVDFHVEINTLGSREEYIK